MAVGLAPSAALSSRIADDEGITFSFSNVMGLLFTILLAVASLTLSLISRSVTPGLLVFALPLFWLKSSWSFCFHGPTVKHRLTVFGFTLRRRQWPLEPEDSVSTDEIADSALGTYRPRWYNLNLWSSSLQKDRTIMRSNDPDDLARLATMINNAIKEVRAKPAS